MEYGALVDRYEDLVTGDDRHPAVEQDEIVLVVECLQPRFTAVGDFDVVVVGEVRRVHICELRLVFDDQHARGTVFRIC